MRNTQQNCSSEATTGGVLFLLLHISELLNQKTTSELLKVIIHSMKSTVTGFQFLLLDCSSDSRMANTIAGHSSSVFYTNLWFPLAATVAAPVVS